MLQNGAPECKKRFLFAVLANLWSSGDGYEA